jgi:hypothetical protein
MQYKKVYIPHRRMVSWNRGIKDEPLGIVNLWQIAKDL